VQSLVLPHVPCLRETPECRLVGVDAATPECRLVGVDAAEESEDEGRGTAEEVVGVGRVVAVGTDELRTVVTDHVNRLVVSWA